MASTMDRRLNGNIWFNPVTNCIQLNSIDVKILHSNKWKSFNYFIGHFHLLHSISINDEMLHIVLSYFDASRNARQKLRLCALTMTIRLPAILKNHFDLDVEKMRSLGNYSCWFLNGSNCCIPNNGNVLVIWMETCMFEVWYSIFKFRILSWKW